MLSGFSFRRNISRLSPRVRVLSELVWALQVACNPLDILDYSHPAVDRTLMRVVAHHCGTAMDIERGAIMDLNLHFTYPSMT